MRKIPTLPTSCASATSWTANSQPHRVLGNARLRREGAEILAGAGVAARLTGDGEAMARTAETVLGLPAGSITPPGTSDRAIEADTELDLGGVRLRLIPVGQAHTQGSLIVAVPEDRVVYAGDVLYGGRLLAVIPVSQVSGWIAAFDQSPWKDLADFGELAGRNAHQAYLEAEAAGFQ